MSRLSSSRVLVWGVALLALLGFSPLATAAVVTWDISASPGITGGSGSWDLTTANWTTDGGVTNQVWADNDDAVFSIVGTGNISRSTTRSRRTQCSSARPATRLPRARAHSK